MKEIRKVVKKLSREQESAAVAAYEPVQKHKVTPGVPGCLNHDAIWQETEIASSLFSGFTKVVGAFWWKICKSLFK